MGTAPASDGPPWTFRIWWTTAAGVLLSVALLPKEGKAGGVALALSVFDVVLLSALTLRRSLPWIWRTFPSRVIRVCLGMPAVLLVVGGFVLLAGAVFVGTGGFR